MQKIDAEEKIQLPIHLTQALLGKKYFKPKMFLFLLMFSSLFHI